MRTLWQLTIGYWWHSWRQLYREHPRTVAFCWLIWWQFMGHIAPIGTVTWARVLFAMIGSIGLCLLWPLGDDDWPDDGGTPDPGDGSHWFSLRR